MVKTRLTTLCSAAAAGLLLATISAAGAISPAGAAGPEEETPSAKEEETPSAKVDLSKRPFVIFSPVPPKPEAVRDYPTPEGAADYWQLWEPGAPWQDAASKIDLCAIHSWMVQHYFTDDELKLTFDWLDEHDIPLGLEMEPLEWPGPEVCDHSESIEGPYDMEMGAPRQAIFVDGEAFKVTPGAEYEFAAVLDIPEASFDAGFAAVMFIADEEVERQNIWFRSKPAALPSVTTDESGAYRVPTTGLDPGRYDVSVDYPGDVDHWAAQADVRLKLR